MKEVKAPYIEIIQGKSRFLLTKLPAGALTSISYAAVRNQSQEEGAVQRILNPSRIGAIKEFTLAGGNYPSALVLNWVSKTNKITKKDGSIIFANEERSAQIIDGQHRIAGIRAAIDSNKSLRRLELPVVIYEGLTTQECADIFLSINTEQKPVPRSLVFDLYGIASESVIDRASIRARDIAIFLNQDESSPYYQLIKLPNSAKKKGGIALSTAVNALKPLVSEKGDFEIVDIVEYQMQLKIIQNWFSCLKSKYGPLWEDRSNIFMYAAGFTAAINFLRLHLIPYCNSISDFTLEGLNKIISLSSEDLILQKEVSGMGGSEAIEKAFERLKAAYNVKSTTKKNIKV